MPLTIDDKLPAIELLKQENIFVMGSARAKNQDIRPLKIAFLNLMPIKITTETDFIRILSNTPLQLEIEFMKLQSHTSKHTPIEHMMQFYRSFEEMKHNKYDGLIITGAPLEHLAYEDVSYWHEIQAVMNWAKTNVYSTCYVCWGAFAALYHFYGIDKHMTDSKIFGVFPHKALRAELPIFRGFDDEFFLPHSRHCELLESDVSAIKELTILAESEQAGITMLMADEGRSFFVVGHGEYSPLTLDAEYKRDRSKGLDIQIPANYYPNDDPTKEPIVRWRSAGNLFFSNWLNYYVYQSTPYNWIN